MGRSRAHLAAFLSLLLFAAGPGEATHTLPSLVDSFKTQAPKPGPRELRIEVCASGINRADILQRKGLYPPPDGVSELLGLEVSGRIAEVGEKVKGFEVGESVMALLAGGGYATEVVSSPFVLPCHSVHSVLSERNCVLCSACLLSFISCGVDLTGSGGGWRMRYELRKNSEERQKVRILLQLQEEGTRRKFKHQGHR